MTTSTVSPPSHHDVEVVVPAPGDGPGNWAGAASAVLVDGVIWLTWRVPGPLTDGRGVAVVVTRSTDGVNFDEVTAVSREAFGAESFERPVLVPRHEGGWRLYLSCATPGSKRWWVDSLTADRVEDLPFGERRRIHEGDSETAVKDPVITMTPDGYEMWLCCHPVDEVGHEDRMTTRWLTSADGVTWSDHGEVLGGREGRVGLPGRPGKRGAAGRDRALRRAAGRGVELVRDDGDRLLGRHDPHGHRRAADRLTVVRRRVPLRHGGGAAGRANPLLRRVRTPGRRARPGHLRALIGVTVLARSA
ncbi:hypothetical protein [Nocardioides sp.]|jgi:hypothetical protein|uniref:hypothetical protein n=1 Tax=Nocardioides sp. TaxID=35761 RepID=UPI00260F4E55|nr:hypothetical protein [Nocardioides sp.]